jgi:hypothetical protein
MYPVNILPLLNSFAGMITLHFRMIVTANYTSIIQVLFTLNFNIINYNIIQVHTISYANSDIMFSKESQGSHAPGSEVELKVVT